MKPAFRSTVAAPPALVQEVAAYAAERPPSWFEKFVAYKKPRVILSLALYRYAGDPRSVEVDLGAVESLGYRMFVRVGRANVASVDCIIKDQQRFYRTHYGPVVESWLKQIRLLRKRKHLAGKRRALRILLVQAHHLTFFWAAGRSPKSDSFLLSREALTVAWGRKLLSRKEAEAVVQEAISHYAEAQAMQSSRVPKE